MRVRQDTVEGEKKTLRHIKAKVPLGHLLGETMLTVMEAAVVATGMRVPIGAQEAAEVAMVPQDNVVQMSILVDTTLVEQVAPLPEIQN